MPKVSSSKKSDESESKKTLPEVLDLKFEGAGEVVLLLEELATIKGQIGTKPDQKKGKEGSGWLAQVDVIQQKLSAIMAVEGLAGLRHNNLVFSDCWVEGRATLDPKTLMIELAMEGVDTKIIQKCVDKATKKGDGYLRRTLTDLNKPRGGWDD